MSSFSHIYCIFVLNGSVASPCSVSLQYELNIYAKHDSKEHTNNPTYCNGIHKELF